MSVVKDVMYCHRAYRRLNYDFRYQHALEFLAMFLPFVVFIILFTPQILSYFNTAAQHLLSIWFGSDVSIVTQPYPLFGDLSLIVFRGSYPTALYCTGVILVSVAGFALLRSLRVLPRSASMYGAFILAVTIVSALYFLFIPERFPYSMESFSDLYIKTEIGIWCTIPFILGMSLMILPSPLYERCAVIAATLLYSVLFGLMRYVVFLYILGKFSYVFMAPMFIAFDPPLDTIYVVGAYSYYMSVVSKRYQKDLSVWQCS